MLFSLWGCVIVIISQYMGVVYRSRRACQAAPSTCATIAIVYPLAIGYVLHGQANRATIATFHTRQHRGLTRKRHAERKVGLPDHRRRFAAGPEPTPVCLLFAILGDPP